MIGRPLRRTEDARLLRGRGRFSDDVSLPSQAYVAMVRSPHPHARIVTIETDRARAMPGVLAVFTGADVAADRLGAIPHNPVPSNRYDLKLRAPGGGAIFIGPHTLLPADRARHVGEAVAMVIAETSAQAEDAAEAVHVTWAPLPFVVDTAEAAGGAAPAVWDEVPTNVCVDASFGSEEAAVDAAFAGAAHVVRHEVHVGRVTGVPLEPRAALGAYEAATGRYVLHAGSGGAFRQRRELCEVLGLPIERLRVVSLDVGGNFGTKNRVYVEYGLVLWAAARLGRPVKYTATRAETLVSDYQGRDLVTRVALALDGAGRFLALRADNVSNVGARAVSFSPLGKGSALVTGPYDIPLARVRARAVFTNTTPTQAYRSSGRPEVTFALERLIDLAARRTGLDPLELRRRNLVGSDRMPYANPFGMVYDSGRYAESMALAMRLADWDGFAARRAEAAGHGRRLGRGLANYVESSVGTPREQARMTVRRGAGGEGAVEVVIGTQPAGQGHETSFAQVAADRLGLDVDRIRILLGDTDLVRFGGGTHSGRSMRMAGAVIALAAEDLIAEGRRRAAQALEAAEADIGYARGRFVVAGTDRGVGLFELPGELAVARDNEMHEPVFPNGCHVGEVEVDPETGAVRLVRYAAVDDVGRAINPLIVDGQTHGGIVQGLGQALGEACVVAGDSGQTLTGSLMDYALLRATDVPCFVTRLNEVPSPTNPLGIKAGGEGGTTPAAAVVAGAIADALAPLGVGDIPLPATPHAIWRAIQAAAGARPRRGDILRAGRTPSMARLTPITSKDQVAAKDHAIVDGIVRSRGALQGPFTMFLHCPELAGRLAHLGAYVRFEGSLDMRVRVLAAMTVARELDAVYVWGAQTGGARRLGVPETTITAIRESHSRGLPPEDAQIVEFTRTLMRRHRVDDGIAKALRARFGDDGFIQLTGAIGYYSMLAMTVNACELEAAPGAEVLAPS